MPLPLTALAEPNRLRIVELLRDRPRPVHEIADRLHLSQPLVSKHLRVLTRERLVRMRPDAQRHIYQLEAARFQELATWLETFRRLWEGRLETLDEYLQGMKAGQATGKKKDPRRTRR